MTKCTFRSYSGRSVSGRGCYKDAVLAAKTTRWSGTKQEEVFAPRCNFHASVDRNRKYGPSEIVDITPEIQAEWDRWEAEEAKRLEEQRATRAIQAAEADKVDKARKAAEHLIEYEITRDDEKEINWAAMREGREDYTLTPRWFIRPIGTEDPRWDEIEVKIERKDGYPDRIDVRNSSRLTPKQALKLGEALQIAFGETRG